MGLILLQSGKTSPAPIELDKTHIIFPQLGSQVGHIANQGICSASNSGNIAEIGFIDKQDTLA